MNEAHIINYDIANDVLYVKLPGGKIVRSTTADGDDFVILNFDEHGEVVGLQLLEISDMGINRWRDCFGEADGIGEELHGAVSKWIYSREAIACGLTSDCADRVDALSTMARQRFAEAKARTLETRGETLIELARHLREVR